MTISATSFKTFKEMALRKPDLESIYKLAKLLRNQFLRLRLKNHRFSLITNNCVGGVITSTLGEQFRSPTVNLWIEVEDYIRFVERLEYYTTQDVVEVVSDFVYPVGLIDDVKIFFMHYVSFHEARNKWQERCARINQDNLFFILVASESCTEEMMTRFDNLPHPKIIFTNQKGLPYKSAHYVKGYENRPIKTMIEWQKNGFGSFLGKKIFDCFNYVKWLNENN